MIEEQSVDKWLSLAYDCESSDIDCGCALACNLKEQSYYNWH